MARMAPRRQSRPTGRGRVRWPSAATRIRLAVEVRCAGLATRRRLGAEGPVRWPCVTT
uniref:Uncharacterized protein n=1 Tax=Arundo donax TaxID=35708 RepID=A0A0A9HCA2_ARUDO